MQETLETLVKQNAEQAEQIRLLLEQNRLLNEKVQLLLSRIFGKKSEKLDPGQLEFLLSGLEPPTPGDDDPLPPAPRPTRKKRDRKPRMPENLPTKEVIVDPEEVKQDPSGYRLIGEEVTEELDVIPTQYFRVRTIRRKFVSKVNRQRPPIIAPLSPRLVEGGYASAGLLADITVKKYIDHMPLYRQEQMMHRHGIALSRKTMADWIEAVANWLTPVYTHIGEDLRSGAYLQVDETPVRYCRKEGGGSGQGYLWVYHRPGGDVLFEWHTSRASDCLDNMLSTFKGTVQCDGYRGYTSYAQNREDIALAGCWAHVRRKFNEARYESPALTGWMLNQIGLIYAIERSPGNKGPACRAAVRSAQSRMIVERLAKAMRLKLEKARPTSMIGSACRYALNLWPQLTRFLDDGILQIDNNPVENAIRPTAIGKKNFLFFGSPDAGQRSAVIYSVLESCRRHGINPHEYLLDVLTKLPSMTNQETRSLTPAAWAEARQRAQAA